MISKDRWGQIIRDFHEKSIPELVERNINIPLEIPIHRAISLIGPRRAGKTYTLFQLIRRLMQQKTPVEQIVYINFERPDLQAETKDLVAMMETFYELYPDNKNKKVWLFLDEIQNIENWEKFVRTIIDNEKVQVFISGSSSKLLSKEVATAMRGRTISYTILPFSFEEHLSSAGYAIANYLSSSEKAKLLNSLNRYMHDGGYPEVVLYPEEKSKLLSEIFETTIYKDVVERYKIRNIKLLKLLLKALIHSSAREFSVHKFCNFVRTSGIKSSKNTLYNYVEALQDVFFIFPLRKFSPTYKNIEQSLPKIYAVDNGILSSNGISDNGRLMENMVFTELLRREKEIYYYRSIGGKEVDFVILQNKRVSELIQVSYSLDDLGTKEREHNALLKASKELKCNNLKIITYETENVERVKGKRITYVPLWKWLLKV